MIQDEKLQFSRGMQFSRSRVPQNEREHVSGRQGSGQSSLVKQRPNMLNLAAKTARFRHIVLYYYFKKFKIKIL
jgi:hypothetical protein